VASGRDSDGNQVAETERYNFSPMTWSTLASLTLLRSHSSYGTTWDGRLLLAGGEDVSTVYAEVSVFDEST